MQTVKEKLTFLRGISIFSSLPDSVLDQTMGALEEVTVKAGETIFQKGDLGTSMYIVVEGQVRVHVGDLTLKMAGPGEVFGEMAALDPSPRSATITAEVDTRLFMLEQKALYAIMDKHVEVAKAALQLVIQALRASDRLWEDDYQHRAALEREMDIARGIQAGFLPKSLPEEPGWEIAAYFKSARQVAGDFYDAFRIPNSSTIGLVIGDVTDKGVGAALFMTLFRSLIRASSTSGYYSRLEGKPSTTLNEELEESERDARNLGNSIELTNSYIANTHGDSSMFATIFYGLLDPASGKMLYINGGHEEIILLRAGGEMEFLGTTGPAVGLFPEAAFGIEEIHFREGDTLIAYTDGIPDAKNSAGETLGMDRLLESLERVGGSAVTLLGNIQDAIEVHTAGTSQFDDITMIAVTRTGKG